MRRNAFFVPAFALLAGIAGFVLRSTQLDTVFDGTTGLAQTDAPITIYLIVVSLAVAVIALIISLILAGRYKAYADYEKAFAPAGLLYLIGFILLGLIMIVGTILYYKEMRDTGIEPLGAVFALFAAMSGISLIVMARSAYKGKGGGEMLLFSVIPSVFLCIWLIIVYKDHASDPILLNYAYTSLAISAAALSFYYGAGYVYSKSKPGKTIFCYIMTIYFCVLTLADSIDLAHQIFFGVIILTALINSGIFVKNLIRKEPEKKAEDVPEQSV